MGGGYTNKGASSAATTIAEFNKAASKEPALHDERDDAAPKPDIALVISKSQTKSQERERGAACAELHASSLRDGKLQRRALKHALPLHQMRVLAHYSKLPRKFAADEDRGSGGRTVHKRHGMAVGAEGVLQCHFARLLHECSRVRPSIRQYRLVRCHP